MNEKNYRTVDSLVGLLMSRGVETDENTKYVIMSESYYAVINGYKDPFINREMMQDVQNDVYRDGTRFSEIYDLFCFDRELRSLTFGYLTKAEAVMKSTTVYAFCSVHPGHEDYLSPQNYVDADRMLLPKGYRGNRRSKYSEDMKSLLETLNKKASGKGEHKDFISHYINKYGYVPLWVLSNDLTFGNMSHFFQLQNPSIQNDVCHQIYDIKKHAGGNVEKITPHEMLRAFSVLVDYRNLCAHDERLYCARVGKSHDISFSDMMRCLKTVLPNSEAKAFRRKVDELIVKYRNRFTSIDALKIFNEMGYEIAV